MSCGSLPKITYRVDLSVVLGILPGIVDSQTKLYLIVRIILSKRRRVKLLSSLLTILVEGSFIWRKQTWIRELAS